MSPLTKQQRACLDAIAKFYAGTGVMPSMEDLRVALGFLSRSSVFRLLRGLQERGAIRRRRGKHRAISILTAKCRHCGEPLERVRRKKS
ncbi:MAG: hypothetical protein ABSC92_15445 [Rhizomicrobium sp.]|jgi:SOS-response transcriptional repressor LexA